MNKLKAAGLTSAMNKDAGSPTPKSDAAKKVD
jgi:hypothetical protein